MSDREFQALLGDPPPIISADWLLPVGYFEPRGIIISFGRSISCSGSLEFRQLVVSFQLSLFFDQDEDRD